MDYRSVPQSMGVYCLTNYVIGRVYVGSAIDMFRRCRRHVCDLRNGVHPIVRLQDDWVNYGHTAFKAHVIQTAREREYLVSLEQLWLDVIQPFWPRGYNECRIARRVDVVRTGPRKRVLVPGKIRQRVSA